MGLQSHLQKVQSDRVLLQQKAIQRHPLADQPHDLLLCCENVGRLLLVRPLRELGSICAAAVKGHNMTDKDVIISIIVTVITDHHRILVL